MNTGDWFDGKMTIEKAMAAAKENEGRTMTDISVGGFIFGWCKVREMWTHEDALTGTTGWEIDDEDIAGRLALHVKGVNNGTEKWPPEISWFTDDNDQERFEIV